MNIVMPSKSYTMKVRLEAVPAVYPTLSVMMHALCVGPYVGIYQPTMFASFILQIASCLNAEIK